MLMKLLERNMDYIKEREIPSQNLPVRMWYMSKEKYCTLIIENKVGIYKMVDTPEEV